MSSPITRDGFDRLSVELKHRKNVERHEITRAIEEARAHGDLKENAEYHAAKDKQGMSEARIRQLEGILGEAEVIDPKRQTTTKVAFGAPLKFNTHSLVKAARICRSNLKSCAMEPN